MISLELLPVYQDRINQYLAEKLANIPVNDQQLLDAINYGLLIGGKRMRPYLAYITADMLALDLNDIDPIAAALECIHAYSLLHDDLPAMDDDDLRRGHLTCHKKFDEATAILAGDSLQTLAFEILSEHVFTTIDAQTQLKLMQMLSRAAGYQGMCGGQALDINATNQQISIEQLESVHLLKTGALLNASILMPANCSTEISADSMSQLQNFAYNIGLLYQVHDDIIDITSSEETLGKPTGSDLDANKSTYPALLGLDGAKQKEQQLVKQALCALDSLPYNTQTLLNFTQFLVERVH